jgi:cellulose synthase/poly-beta-1,6-N-acetylglucosamine synthase-like glycosyltransferase
MNFMQDPITLSFLFCLVVVVYAYLAYPAIIWCLAHMFGQRHRPPADRAEALPPISVLIVAYNEEAVLEARLLNALATDYPKEKLEIVVASDGSTDRTEAIVRKYERQGVRLLNYKVRRGKATVLNVAIKEVRGEIVILSDANTHTEPDAARKLVRWFRDPQMGVVCGRLVLTDSHTGRNVDSLYWQYETFLKRSEGRLGALLGANGAIYAIRHSFYTPIPNDTLVDDLVIPLWARLTSGCAIVYDSEAVAHEETAPAIGHEFHRRSRFGAGGWQCLGRLWPLMNPSQGWIAFTFISHKCLRWLGPFFLIGMFVSNFFLCDKPLFQWLLFGQLSFYAVALLGAFMPPPIRPLKALRLATMFAGMNLALLLGFWRWLHGSQHAAWKRTRRRVELMDPLPALSHRALLPDIPTPLPALNCNGHVPEINGTRQ